MNIAICHYYQTDPSNLCHKIPSSSFPKLCDLANLQWKEDISLRTKIFPSKIHRYMSMPRSPCVTSPHRGKFGGDLSQKGLH